MGHKGFELTFRSTLPLRCTLLSSSEPGMTRRQKLSKWERQGKLGGSLKSSGNWSSHTWSAWARRSASWARLPIADCRLVIWDCLSVRYKFRHLKSEMLGLTYLLKQKEMSLKLVNVWDIKALKVLNRLTHCSKVLLLSEVPSVVFAPV